METLRVMMGTQGDDGNTVRGDDWNTVKVIMETL